MTADARRAKRERIRGLIESEGETVAKNTRHLNESRYAAIEELGEAHEELRTLARDIKEESIERLPELIETLTESVEGNGGEVYVASDAADANEYVRSVCRDAGAEVVVKSKSMTTEEIEVNEALESIGCEVVETDLGELVIQIAEESPSHIVGPSLHKSTEEIAVLFNDHFDLEQPLETPQELTAFARDHLVEKFRQADVGMTGANFVVAETGSIALITNEGNARKTVEATNTHIAVAGVEKVIPTLSDLGPFMELVARSATGESLSSYTSVFSPPIATPPFDGGERSFHLVLIDNGRMAMREDPHLRETLYCVRCSACLNSCANFQSVGGHAFGGETYTGGIGTGWEAGVHGLDSAAAFNDLCTGCSRCVNQCPVKIDIPWINEVVRDRINRGADPGRFDFVFEGLVPDEEPAGLDLQKRFFGNFETVARVASATAPVSNWLANAPPSRWALDRFVGVEPERELPAFRRETLRDWFEAREPTNAEEPVRRVVCYPDLYTNYIETDRGKGAVETLEALGCEVAVPDVPASGRAPLSQGMIETARTKAEDAADVLEPYIEDGWDVVVVEPSDLAMFRRDNGHLLPAERHERLAENSYELFEYVYGLLEGSEGDGTALRAKRSGNREVIYHRHCQQRTLGLEAYTVAVLERLGYDVATSRTECCGMAGSFGYKSEYYELSMEVGSLLGEQLLAERDRRVVASGTSCTDQIEALVGERPTHPVELLVDR
ncbi:LUD domain-containing protein [Natronorarus salvus]|uniref:LUD domain-containing protein n=1 Tax=Natronorarus salvus TaxID=3117733 RepID=UPI002F268C93